MLRDLTIQNYRAFKDFHVDDLAWVNLIVGANNSGKTSLLEAVYLLSNRDEPHRILEIMERRGELVERISMERSTSGAQALGVAVSPRFHAYYSIAHLFHGRQIQQRHITIKSHQDQELALNIRWQTGDGSDKIPTQEIAANLIFDYDGNSSNKIPLQEDNSIDASTLRPASKPSQHHRYIETNHLDVRQLREMWDDITLTPKEDDIVEALRILEPGIERINFTSQPTSTSGVLLKFRGNSEPIPLGSMGDGVRRLLGLAMSAVMVENGTLLVDEIDTGLYYQTQADMWRLILGTAQRLNVQVFATTHSNDCVNAFQEALMQSKDRSVGKLFRLSLRGDDIQAIPYTADELDIAVRQGIEVR